MKTKHLLIMIACCAIPLVAFTLITVFNMAASSVLTIGLVLLCPLGHVLMMLFMGHGHDEHYEEAQPARQSAGGEKALGHPAHMRD